MPSERSDVGMLTRCESMPPYLYFSTLMAKFSGKPAVGVTLYRANGLSRNFIDSAIIEILIPPP
jgi:hypothetical protein